MWKNTEQSFGRVHRLLHWLMALLIVGMICVGLYAVSLDADNPDQRPLLIRLIGLHKATGIVVLCLVLARLAWLYFNGRPRFPDTMARWQRLAARTSHVLLYAVMLALPVSGFVMSSFAGKGVDVYGLFVIPPMLEKSRPMAHTMAEVHEFLAYTLITLIVIHLCGALKHHFIDGDNVLKRMLGRG